MITIERKQRGGKEYLDITVGGVTIYGCQRRQGVGAKGPYDFICRQEKGKDDKWYNVVKFSDGVTAAIIAELDGGGSGGMDEPGFDPESEIPFLAPAHWMA